MIIIDLSTYFHWLAQFVFQKEDDEAAADDNIESPLPNLLELFYNFEQAGIGLGREEIIRIWLALKKLVDNYPLQTVRFWGKIFGTEQNYIVAEAEYREGEEEEPEESEEAKPEEQEEEKPDDDEEGTFVNYYRMAILKPLNCYQTSKSYY